MAAEEAGIERKTNHSARKTAVKNLGKAGIPAYKTIQMTRHKSLLSIASYDNELSDEEQENFSDILTRPSIFTQSGKHKNSVPLTARPELNALSVSMPQSPVPSQSLTQSKTHNVNKSKSSSSMRLPRIFGSRSSFSGCSFNLNFSVPSPAAFWLIARIKTAHM